MKRTRRCVRSKLIAFVLSVLMLFYAIPAIVYAETIDALFNNGGKVLLPFETKPITTLVGYLPNMKANQYSLKKYMSSQSKGEMPYAFAISEVGELFKAVFCPDPLYQANERGYKLQ